MIPTYRQLLVHLDSSGRASVRLKMAQLLAQDQGADVLALYAVMPTLVALPIPPTVSADTAASIMEIDDARRRRTRAVFEQALEGTGIRPEWGEVGDLPVIPAFAQQALYADLLVLGQHDPATDAPADVPPDFAESVMLASGKPALVVPYAGMPRMVGDTILIAWKETREAARAVSAALPMLRRAQAVHVVAWGSDNSTRDAGPLHLGKYLALHQVGPVWHHQGKEPEHLGEILLSTASDVGADLLVMGCYGHSRAREWILGGTSRTILQSMTMPVLMAH